MDETRTRSEDILPSKQSNVHQTISNLKESAADIEDVAMDRTKFDLKALSGQMPKTLPEKCPKEPSVRRSTILLPNPEKPLRVVATFTTLPDRYDLVRESIKSMRAQDWPLDAIYLAVPLRARRLNQEYPPIPDDINELCTVIRIDVDYGPVTKLYGGLISEIDPDTIIISCDDDVIYKPNLVRKLVEHFQQHPGISICGTGALIGKGLPFISIISSLSPFRTWNGLIGPLVPKGGRAVDLIFGVAGVLYQRGFFPDVANLHDEFLRYSLENEYVFVNDDVLISGYLSRKGIKRMVFYDIPDVTCQGGNRKDALSYDLMSMLVKLDRSITYMKSQGFFPATESVELDETPAGRVIFAIVIAVLILVLCFFFYRLV